MKKLTALFLAILTLFCFTACAAELQNADASEKAEAAEGEEAVDVQENALPDGFNWKKEMYDNCGSYPASELNNMGIVVGDEEVFYYNTNISLVDGEAVLRNEWAEQYVHIVKYDGKTGEGEDTYIKYQGNALTQMNYYKGNLYCMYEGMLYCYTPETGGDTEITGVDNGVIVDGKMFCIDVINEEKRLGNLCFTDLATFEDVEVATGVYSRFIYFNDEKVYYSVKTKNGYDVFAYDVKLQESELLKTVDAAPCHMLGEMVICKEKYGAFMYGEEGKRTIIPSRKYLNYGEYKNIVSFFGNGNMLFFTMRRGVDQEEQGLDLYAYCTDNEEYYYLGIVPDPHLTILGETLCCYSAHKYGNVSLVNFVDGKAAVTPLKFREPYPYGY